MTSLVDRLHPVDKEVRGHYLYLLERGRCEAARSTLAVGMIARDCAAALGRTLDAVAEVGEAFSDYEVHIATNDCQDDTCGVISRKNMPIVHTDETLGRPNLSGGRESERTEALAEYRNAVRDRMPAAKWVLILDADLMEVTSERLLAGFGDMLTAGTDAMAAQNLVYKPELTDRYLISYDAFAYRPDWGWKTSPLIERAFHYDVRPSGTKVMPVKSAFGGACWYWGDVFREKYRRYDGSEGCEHVPFHRSLKMGVSPSMSVIGFLS